MASVPNWKPDSFHRNEASKDNTVESPYPDEKIQNDSKLEFSESKAERSMDDEKSKDDGAKSTGRLKIKFSNPRQTMQEVESPKL